MAEKNVILKDGEDILYPKTKAELVEGLPQGGAEWGDITGTLSNQTDLKNVLDGKLDVSGGTMTGAIKLRANGTQLQTPRSTILLSDYGYPIFGDLNTTLGLNCRNQRIEVISSGYPTATALHTGNTEANPTLAGTEADLTSLKLNGTTYKVPSGSLYQHNVAFTISSPKGYVNITFLNKSATPMATITDIKSALIGEGFESGSNVALKPCCGNIAGTNVFGCNVYNDAFRVFYLMQSSPYEQYPSATVIATINDVVDTVVQIS